MKFSEITKTASYQHGYEDEMEQPTWEPQRSAVGVPDGERAYGSTGQLFEARNGQWVRVVENDPRLPGGKFYPA